MCHTLRQFFFFCFLAVTDLLLNYVENTERLKHKRVCVCMRHCISYLLADIFFETVFSWFYDKVLCMQI